MIRWAMLVLAGMAFFSGSAYSAYTVLIGVYTTDQSSADACGDHRDHPTDGCFSASNTLDGAVNVCAGQDIHWHNGQPGYPNIYPDRYYSITTEDCGGQCPAGQEPTGPGGMCVAQASCPTDDIQKFHSDVLGAMPDYVCSNGCWYNNISDGLYKVDMANGGWLAEFQSTGFQCAVETDGEEGGGAPENCIVDSTTGEYFCPGDTQAGAPPNCIEDGKGNQICIDQYDPLNFG